MLLSEHARLLDVSGKRVMPPISSHENAIEARLKAGRYDEFASRSVMLARMNRGKPTMPG